jgi:predicted nuclease with TOPRIM domain
VTPTPEPPATNRRPFAHVVAGFALTSLVAVYTLGVPGEMKTREENSELREKIAASQEAFDAHTAEAERLRAAEAEKTEKLNELQGTLASTEGFLQ